jgi:3-oxoacyl-(acyl-carrier-protein) synthase
MADRIVVSAMGIVSALGSGIAANLQALRASQSGLHYPQLLQTNYAKEYLMGEVDRSNDELSSSLGLPVGNNGYTRTTLLALIAMQELVSQLDRSLIEKDLAFINANTVGGMCSVENMYLDFISDKTEGDFIKYIDTLDCAESTINVAKYFGIKPFMATISTACSSSANALLVGSRMIQQGLVKRAICGGCDSLSRYTVNGFASLKNVSKSACMPFDQNRTGLNLGEGAGYLLLEKESDAIARGAHIIAVFSGYGNSNDAYHPTAPSPDGAGAYRTMEQALKKAKLQPQDIDYINAHGTATENNDSAEGKAIENMFGKDVPFSSTKPFTGHTLAAAGVIEAIFSIWAMQENTLWPNMNFHTPMENIGITPVVAATQKEVQHVLSNSFGFGGNNVSLLFSKA